MFDVVIIGGGPAGYVAAIRAAQLKLNVVLIEEKHLGGICANWGCIPTKALLKSAEKNEVLKHAEDFGLKAKNISFDLEKVVSRSRAVSAGLVGGVTGLLKKNKIKVIEGKAFIKGPNKLKVASAKGDEIIEAHNIIIATGARPRVIPGLEPDGKFIVTYKEAMIPNSIPKKLVIVGSGAIGIEFASFYNSFGAEVTVLEMQDRILPVEDSEISNVAKGAFEKQGIKFHLQSNLKKIDKTGKALQIHFETLGKDSKIDADQVIMAVGIVANVENIGLENTKVQLDKNHIVTDAFMQTHEKSIYAIGDVAGAPWLAHKASHEAVICIEKIAGLKPKPLNKENIPGCTYSMPQIASVGLTEEAAKQKYGKIKVGKFPFMANGKAIASNQTTGMIKTIFDEKTGELLGAHMVGAEVTELIQGFVIAKSLEATEEDLMHVVFAHPTLSEMMHESVLAADAKAIHI